MFHQGTFLLCVTTIVLKNTIAKSPLSKMGIRNGNLELLGGLTVLGIYSRHMTEFEFQVFISS